MKFYFIGIVLENVQKYETFEKSNLNTKLRLHLNISYSKIFVKRPLKNRQNK